MTAIIVIAAIAAVLVIWFISVQRKLVNKDELCRNSMSQIGVQQESRWDAVTAYNRLVRQFPDSIVAGALHFAVKEYLKEPAGKTDMPPVKF